MSFSTSFCKIDSCISKKNPKKFKCFHIYTRREKRGSPNSEPQKNEVPYNWVEMKMELGTVDMFDLFSSDDDTNKKPRSNKNTAQV